MPLWIITVIWEFIFGDWFGFAVSLTSYFVDVNAAFAASQYFTVVALWQVNSKLHSVEPTESVWPINTI